MAGSSLTREEPVSARDVEASANRIASLARETPLLPSGEISRRVGAPVTLKAECLQRTGSFKIRGAANRVARLSAAELRAGVVAASAGNHAQAVALAAGRRGEGADLFVPATAPATKVEAARSYGGEVHLVGGSYDDAAEEAKEFVDTEGGTLIPPFDDPDIVSGAGTVGAEIARQAPRTRQVVVPIGGGALASGVAIAVKWLLPEVRVAGVQAAACAPYSRDGANGARSRPADTICDGIAVKRPGELTGPLVERWVDDVVCVSDNEVAEAIAVLLARAKLVVEGAGAASVAALISGRVSPAARGETCAVLSGGNVDASGLLDCVRGAGYATRTAKPG